MNQEASGGEIRLTVPATAAHLRHVRVLTATVADDSAFDVEQIESLRVAVDELCALALGEADDGGTLAITLRATTEALELEGTCDRVREEPVIDPIAAQLLAAGSDEHDLSFEDGTCHFRLRAQRPTVGLRRGD